MEITLYGVLAEIAGKNKIKISRVNNVYALRLFLCSIFPGFNDHNFHIAVNRRKADDAQLISENDEIALLPPFAGG